MNMCREEEIRRTQIKLDTLGNRLRLLRHKQQLSLEEVAKRVNIEPEILCFLESGWTTIDEFLAVIDQWALALKQDPLEFHQQLKTTGQLSYE